MSWIKRNLYFVVGGAVALILMCLAGFYLYSKWQRNTEIMQKLDQDFAELQRLNSENPHPGSGTVDNIAEAQTQQRQLREFIAKLKKNFQPIPPIPNNPDNPKVSDRDFSSALARTIDQLQRAASSTSVNLPPAYSFSFEAQRPRVTFSPGSTGPLSVQLGEVKAICDILIGAKVNSIDNIRRERVSADDMTGPQMDYTDLRSSTNELAVLTPYEITFRCFSSELAAVLSGFAASPHAILVKSMNVEPGTGTNTMMMTGEQGMMGTPVPGMPAPGMSTAEADAFSRRYGTARGGPGMAEAMPGMGGAPGAGTSRYGTLGGGTMGGATPGGAPGGMRGEPGMVVPRTPTYAAPAYAAPSGAASRSAALPTVLDEKQLKVTMELVVVKLTPSTPRK